MRILRLDLDRYGPFTGRSLAFDPAAKLHVVFGRNETGKTSSLAAVTDLLFGIERSTPYGFMHDARNLQIGALIRSSNGSELEFRRRRNRPVLSDKADVALADDALAPFLGGLTRAVFRRAFGLDAESLRKSAEDLKATEGELGAALFSAASGLRGFSELKSRLEAEADGIFAKTRAQHRTFYQAHDRYEAARRDLRAHETRAGALKELRDDIQRHSDALEVTKTRRPQLAAEQARIQRLKRAAPILKAIADDEASLDALGKLPSAPDGIGAAILRDLEQARAARAALDDALQSEARLRDTEAGVHVDDLLLEAAERIETLLKGSGAYRKAQQDLPALERDTDEAFRQLTSLAARLGHADTTTILSLQPDDASRAHLAELVERGRAFSRKIEAHASELARERETHAEKSGERDRRGYLQDPRPIRERATALAPLVRAAEQIAEQRGELAAEIGELTSAAARLSPSVSDLASIAIRALPQQDTIVRYAKHLDEIERRHDDACKELEAAHSGVTSLEGDIRRLTVGGDVASPERIQSARQARDEHWATLSATLFARPGKLEAADLPSATAAFESAKAEADRLADLAIVDANRVATHAEINRRLAEERDRIRAAEQRLEDVRTETSAARDDWRRQWTALQIDPLPPAEMLSWRVQMDGLLARHSKAGRVKATIAESKGAMAGALTALRALARELGLPAIPELGIPELARRIDNELERLADAWDKGRSLDTLLSDLEERISKQDQALAAAGVSLDVWKREFGDALPRIGLHAGANIVEADAVLTAWKEFPGAASKHETLQRRVIGIKRDATTFTEATNALLAEVAPDLLAAPPDEGLAQISRRLKAALEMRARKLEVGRRLSDAVEKTAECRALAGTADRTLTELAEKIGSAVDTALERTAQTLVTRDALISALRRRRSELANAADGRDETILRAELADFDSDAAEAELARSRQEEAQLIDSSQEAYAARQKAIGDLSALEVSVEAEVAMQQRRNAEAEMLEAARRWAVLRVGALMIGAAIDRQRSGRQEPLMTRAGELFAGLTGAVFQGLGQSYDDSDTPYLVGRRADGRDLKVTEMSEGAGDQLYFALRLAYLEDYASRSEPAPFIADDLFASFDDERTAYGLRALAAISDKVQPIVFTHHRFVADAAQRELGAQADIIELT